MLNLTKNIMRKEESLKTFKRFQTLTDRSKDLADSLEELQDNLYGKIDKKYDAEMTKIWDKMYNLYLDMLFIQDDLIDNLK